MLKAVTTLARNLRKNSTDAERALWRHLRGKQFAGSKFRLQQPIGQYIVDLVRFEKKIVIEVDGEQHSNTQYQDASRDALFKAQGFTVCRFWNHEVLQNMEGVVSDTKSPAPFPSHQGRGKKLSQRPPI